MALVEVAVRLLSSATYNLRERHCLRFTPVLLTLAILLVGVGCDKSEFAPEIPEPLDGWFRYDYCDPAWSPRDEYVAYVYVADSISTLDSCGLYVYDMIDSTSIQLISSVVIPGRLDISPDGRWIAFSWYHGIWKCLANGDSLVQLTSGEEWDVSPAWSPSGERIAYNRLGDGTHIMNSDGSRDIRAAGGGYPQWLDENHIAYIGLYCHIYLFDLETSEEKLLFERLPEWVGDSVRELDASSTGTRLLFSAFTPGEGPNVYRLDLDLETPRLTQLTTTGGDQPAWSPDGSEIVYTNTQVGRIWLMGADGSNKRPLF